MKRKWHVAWFSGERCGTGGEGHLPGTENLMRIGLVLLVARLGVSPAFGQLTEEKTEQIVTRVVKTELADTKTELKDYVTLQRQVLECQPEEREKHREAELRATRAALKGEIATLRMWVLAGFGLWRRPRWGATLTSRTRGNATKKSRNRQRRFRVTPRGFLSRTTFAARFAPGRKTDFGLRRGAFYREPPLPNALRQDEKTPH